MQVFRFKVRVWGHGAASICDHLRVQPQLCSLVEAAHDGHIVALRATEKAIVVR